MKYEVIFCIFALVLTAGVVGAFAWALLGHSKGGNLAVYAAAFCPAALQERIAAVYNNDGPGFDAEVIALPGYQRICARVQTFVPQSSIVGMLLEHEEAYTIIHSTGDGFGQHNLYTWEVLRDRFVTLETVTNGSQAMPRSSTSWSCVNFVVTELKRKNGIERFTIFAVVMRPVSSSLPVWTASQPIPAVRTRTSTLEIV